MALHLGSTPKDLDDSFDDLVEFASANRTDSIEDKSPVRSEDPVGADIAHLSEATFGKVSLFQRHRIPIFSTAAGDLAEDQVISLKRGDNQGRTSLGLAKI